MKDSKKKLMNDLALKKAEYFSLQGKYNNLKDEYDRLKKHTDCLEKYCNSLSSHCNCCKSKFESNYQEYIKQMEDKIASLIRQRDNWKADCEYNEECFQAEREAKYRLEDEINVLKGQKIYPCISMNCNDITGESSSLYFCFSYDDRVLLANNVPGSISMDKFVIKSCYIDSAKGGLIYEIEYLLPQFIGDKLPYSICNVKFEVSYDLKKVISSCIPRGWNNYCNHKSNKDVENNYFQRKCFLGVNNRLHLCISANKFILLDMQPELWIQKSDKWKIWYDDKTKEGLVQIYDNISIKVVTYYIENDKQINKIVSEQIVR